MNQHLSHSYRRYALALLLTINLLNYIDRQVLYAVFPLLKSDLSLSDTALGLLGSAFMVVYMVTAPFFGWLGDRKSRTTLAAGGLTLWSLATVGAGMTAGYRQLLVARSLVGIGEASFGTVSPGLVADFFPKERRGKVLSLFYLAIPVGSALGYLLGGLIGQKYGWQTAFLLVGTPGLLLVLPLARLKPPRPALQTSVLSGNYRDLLTNRSFILNTFAMTAMTFSIGGLAQWMPTFLYRYHQLDVARGNTVFGGITVVSGIFGTLAGGWLGDRLQRKRADGYLLVSAAGFLLALPLAAYALLTASKTGCLGAMFLAELFLFFNTGPLNTVIVNVTPRGMRAMAFALNIFVIHALGDAVSPALIGVVSDRWELRFALLLTIAAIAFAAMFCFLCGRRIFADMVSEEQG